MLLPIEPEMLLHDQPQSPAATLAMILDFVFEDLVGPTLFQGSCFPNSTAYSPFYIFDWSDLSDLNKGRDRLGLQGIFHLSILKRSLSLGSQFH